MKVKSRKFPKIIILLILLFSFFPQNHVKAANIVVDTDIDDITANGGVCTGMQISDLPGPEGLTTLREAICAANGTPGADTISFAGNHIITLANLQLPPIKTEITINGNGINNTIIQASTCNPVTVPVGCTPADHRVFQVSTGELFLNNLTVRHGNPIDNGGGIMVDTNGSLDLNNCSITGNKADYGAGIANTGTISTINQTSFSGNQALQHGGGIYQDWLSEIGSIENSTFTSNAAESYGGAISNDRGRITAISQTNFEGNHSVLNGGGIWNFGNIGSIEGGSFSGNSAEIHGGAIYNHHILGLPNIALITGVEFSGNTAVLDGGAIRNNSKINLISGCTFSNNSADQGGAFALYRNSSYALIENSIFTSNTAINGGGISVEDGNLDQIIGSQITNNSAAVNGAGLYIGSTGTLSTIDNSTFSNNDAINQGGGLYNSGGLNNIFNSSFDGNSSNIGGGIYNNSPISMISHSTFAGNHGLEGGAIYNDNTITTISNSTFSGNSAKDFAGGIYNLNTIDAITNTTFYGNYGEDFGGGIFNSGTINTINSTIVVNSPAGGNCRGAPPVAGAHNLTDFRDCWSWDDSLNYNTHLDPLSDNGGPTRTHALVFTSPANPAINTGPAACSSPPVNDQDQRGITRSLYGNCDIGAYEYSGDNIELVVLTSNPSDGAQVQNVPHITVSFNKNVVHDGGTNAVNNPDNYLLVEEGKNKIFDTRSCLNGLQADDTQIQINTIAYNTTSHIAALTPDPSPLPSGNYRLFVCGTTSIFDLVGLELNYGLSDTLIDITVLPAINNLPRTGFAPGSITGISEQPEQKAYTLHSDMWLEIPQIGLEANIVGVPIVEGNWDVTWLGNNAGYLTGTAFPTWEGNTVLTGHVWNAWNEPGPFSNIKTLQFGDQFYIHAYGRVFAYEVQKNFRIYPNSQNALSHSDFDTVTLLTCEGWNKWTGEYQYRRAVKAVLVNIRPE